MQSDSHARETSAVSGAADSPLLLVVDDDPLNRTVMSAMLRKLGYRFHLATNGREAVDAVFRDRYAAVLMDCLMPEMDGYEATAAIRQHEREHQPTDGQRRLPIIAVTAVAIKGARERCIEAGMDDYLSKPVIVQSVVDLLGRWVGDASADSDWSVPHADGLDVPEDEAIDPAALDALRELDPESGDALVAEMVQDFDTEVTPHLQSLHRAAASADIGTVLQELHFIAGCASIVGATRVERLARSLEAEGAVAALGGPTDASGLAGRVEEEVARAQSVLRSIVSGIA